MTQEIALYQNWKGDFVTHVSYSARRTYKYCPKSFEYDRVQGWYDRTDRASTLFGKCTEYGIQYFYENDCTPGMGGLAFNKEWEKVKTIPEFPALKYTDCEGDWYQLSRAGQEMMRLLEGVHRRLPISRAPKALFQFPVRKKLFPGTELDVLTNKAVFDILSYPNNGAYELIIDVKTMGADLDEDLVALDPQLLEYAWEYGCPNIAFLWLVKKSHEIEKGSLLTLLTDLPDVPFGTEVYCLRYEKADPDEGRYYDIVVFGAQKVYDAYLVATKGLRGRVLENAKDEFIALTEGVYSAAHRAADGTVNFTKQRLQFAAAQITQEFLDNVGRDVAKVTVEMVESFRTGYYPRAPGIRFPDQKCQYCSYKWLCLNRPKERDKFLGKRGQEWLDGEEGTDD